MTKTITLHIGKGDLSDDQWREFVSEIDKRITTRYEVNMFGKYESHSSALWIFNSCSHMWIKLEIEMMSHIRPIAWTEGVTAFL